MLWITDSEAPFDFDSDTLWPEMNMTLAALNKSSPSHEWENNFWVLNKTEVPLVV